MSNTIEMAIMADLIYNKEGFCPYVEDTNLIPFIKAFEALVRANEREECAQICLSVASHLPKFSEGGFKCCEVIRARGETK